VCYVRAVPTAKRPEAKVTRSGTVAIVGRPNVGKSTLLNAALAVDLAIVSKTPQTTRENLLGVLHRTLSDGTLAELLLLDTPGLHEGKTTLNKRMNRVAKQASAAADVVIMTTEVPKEARRELLPYGPDVALVRQLAQDAKVVLVVNKIDRLKDKTQLFTLIGGWTKVREFEAVVPTSALKKDGVEPILEEVGRLLPEAAHQHGVDDLTDRPSRFFAAQFVREQVLKRAWEEVPHATTVSIEEFEEHGKGVRISATVHVERDGQKKILIGEKGSMLKQIGTDARKRIADLIGVPVHLELFVRTTPGWRDNASLLDELGYAEGASLHDRAAAAPRKPARKHK